jgi:hypothetical protein
VWSCLAPSFSAAPHLDPLRNIALIPLPEAAGETRASNRIEEVSEPNFAVGANNHRNSLPRETSEFAGFPPKFFPRAYHYDSPSAGTNKSQNGASVQLK